MKKYILLVIIGVFILSINAQNSAPEANLVATTGLLTVRVTTSTAGGNYSPNNIEAIWILDSSGKFVKTLLLNAGVRKQYLSNWNTSSSGNVVDAITGATQSTHKTLTCTWDGTNSTTPRVIQNDGTYTVKMELTDKNATGNVGTFTFNKSAVSQTVSPANVASFSNVSISWVPTSTGVNEVKLAKLYSIYPNPTKSTVYIDGTGILDVEIFSVDGKSMLKSNVHNINLSALDNGTYLALIRTTKGDFIKKIVKN